MRTVKMLVLSPLVTAASASAPTAPALSRSSRSKPEPTIRGPSHSFRRRKARAFLSMIATEWPWATREMARPEPTRPHPTTITCTPQHNTPRGAVQRGGTEAGARLLLRWRRGARSRTSAPRPFVGDHSRHHPRAAALSAEEQAARAATGYRAAQLRTPR